MRILSDGTTIEVSNADLEPRSKSWRVWEHSKLKQEVIDALHPREQQDADTLLFSILRVRKGTRRFQLPEDSVLLALEGRGKVRVPGACAIWYCEAALFKADVAVLGAGEIERLNCDVVSLQSQDEVRDFLTGIWDQGLGRLRVGGGRIEYLLHTRQDPDDRQYQLGAKIEGSGILRRLKIGTVDQAISGYGKVSVQYAVRLNEALRGSIHDLLWESTSAKRSERIDRLLDEEGISKSPLKKGLSEHGDIGTRNQSNAESRGARKGEAQKPLEQTIVPQVSKETRARRIARRLIGRR